MNLWWTEMQTQDLRFGLRCSDVLVRQRSQWQEIAVYQSEQYGRLLTLDDTVMTTEADEFVYHEMLVHCALCVCPSPKRVLVIGGGDGGCVREVCKYSEVERVVLAELDESVIDVARLHLPTLSCALSDPRVEVQVGDGASYVTHVPPGSFDAIVVDAPDPVGPAAGLFEEGFYTAAAAALAPEGVLAAQTECPFLHGPLIARVQRILRRLFPVVGLCWAVVPTYPGAMWTFSVATKGAGLSEILRVPAGTTRYWTDDIQRAAFTLPVFLRELLAGVGA